MSCLDPLLGLVKNDRLKFRVYVFLNQTDSWFQYFYQVLMVLLIVICVVAAFYTPSGNDPVFSADTRHSLVFFLDIAIGVVFTIEFIIRVWAFSCLHRYRNWRNVHIILHPMFLLDLVVILTTFSVVFFDSPESIFAICLRGFRVVHLFENKFQIWKIVSSVVWSQRYQLAIVSYFCVLWLIIFSLAIFYVESETNEKLKTVPECLWFTLVTFTTVGYGDITPVTSKGKAIVSIGMVIGVSVFALPGGVIGAGLALKLHHMSQEPNGKNGKPVAPLRETIAANVLQSAWRLFLLRKRIFENEDKKKPENIKLIVRKRGIVVKPSVLYVVTLLKYSLYRNRLRSVRRFSRDSASFYAAFEQNSVSVQRMLCSLNTKMKRIDQKISNLRPQRSFANLWTVLYRKHRKYSSL